jgi:hypothetical protein
MLRVVALLALLVHHPVPDLDRKIEYWKNQLDLRDWVITLKIVSANELDPYTLGDIEPYLQQKTAKMRILREEDQDLPRYLARSQQLLTVAHEMVHLKRLTTLGRGSWSDERATNTQTVGLLRAHRDWRALMAVEQP